MTFQFWVRYGLHMAMQMEFLFPQNYEPDRNHHRGGRSFYFFDFDQNIASLNTRMYLRHKETGLEIEVSGLAFAQMLPALREQGEWQGHVFDYDDQKGSFRNFRDHDREHLVSLGKKHQLFVEDILEVLQIDSIHWMGPSWQCFQRACHNQRPLSLITARGHHPETIRQGIREFVRARHLSCEPNYLSIYPIHHPDIRNALGDSDLKMNAAQLKKVAIRKSVEQAFLQYGENTHHRFGMSDDDPENLERIFEVMHELKQEFPENSFFVFEAQQNRVIKHEILSKGESEKVFSANDTGMDQLFLDFELADVPSSER